MKVIIIGAGISGLTMGILLRQKNFDVTIYEKKPCFEAIGGGLGIWPNGSQVLLNLPCAKKITLLIAPISSDIFIDAVGDHLMKVPRNIFLKINGYPIMNVCRSELHQILLEEFGAHHIKFSTKCIGIEHYEKKTTIFFDDTQETADLVIGADGIYSTMRKFIFQERPLQYLGYLHLLGVLKLNHDTFPNFNFIYGKNRYCLRFPISDDRHIFYQVLPYERGLVSQIKNRTDRISLFRGWSKESDSLMNTYEKSLLDEKFHQHFYCEEAYTIQPLSTWHHNRLVLIGDAAHPMGSIMGLGVGLALEDCQVLSSLLSNTHNINEAISLYEARQIVRAAKLYQLEKETTDFILHANEEIYINYINHFKQQSPESANKKLMNYLKI